MNLLFFISVISLILTSVMSIIRSNSIYRDVNPINKSFKKFIRFNILIMYFVSIIGIAELASVYLYGILGIQAVYAIISTINLIIIGFCLNYVFNLSYDIVSRLILYDRVGSILESRGGYGIFEMSLSDYKMYCSNGIYKIMGAPDDDIITLKLIRNKIVSSDKSVLDRLIVDVANDSDTPTKGIFRVNTMNGIKFIEVHLYTAKTGGQVDRVYGTFDDITEYVHGDMRRDYIINLHTLQEANDRNIEAYKELKNSV